MTIRLTRARVALATAVLGIVVAGASYAGIPAADGTISACKDSKGALKVIDAEGGQTCASNQQLLTWSEKGPHGAPGISGYQIVRGEPALPQLSESAAVAEAPCPHGKKAVGGGGLIVSADAKVAATASYATNVFNDSTTGLWRFGAREMVPNTNVLWYVEAWAICAYVA